MRAAGYLLGLLVFLLCSQAWAEQQMAIATPVSVFTRPADTTTYGSGDLVANSTTAASVVPMSWSIVTPPKGGAFIRRANIRKSSIGVVAPNFRLHLFTTSPTSAVGDNGVYSSTSVGWFCDLDVNMYTTDPFFDGNGGIGVPNNGAECAVVPTASTIYGLLEARGAYVPTNGEAFSVTLEVYGPGVSGGGAVAATPSWVLPGASLDFDFANQRYWNSSAVGDTGISVTRATAETCTSLAGVLTYAAAGAACITDAGLQSWQVAVNLLLQSQFAATWTATRSTLTPNVVVSPDTATNAASLIEDATATDTHLTTQTVTKAASAIPYTFSVYAKTSTRTRIALQLDDAAGNGVYMVCNLSGQSVGVTATGVGTPFTTLSSGAVAVGAWTRCFVNATTNTATSLVATVFLDSGAGTAALSNSYSGDGVSGAPIFGAQLEQNVLLSPSPYIPTTIASATRNADIISRTIGVGSLYTLYGMGRPQIPASSTISPILLSVDNNTITDYARINRTSTGTASTVMSSASSLTYNVAGAAWLQYASGILAAAFSAGAQTSAFNGTALAAGTGAALPVGPVTLHIGIRSDSGGSTQWEGTIQRIAVFNSYVTNLTGLTR